MSEVTHVSAVSVQRSLLTTHAMIPQAVVGVPVRQAHASCGGSLETDGRLLRLAGKSAWSTPGQVMTCQCHLWQAVQYP